MLQLLVLGWPVRQGRGTDSNILKGWLIDFLNTLLHIWQLLNALVVLQQYSRLYADVRGLAAAAPLAEQVFSARDRLLQRNIQRPLLQCDASFFIFGQEFLELL